MSHRALVGLPVTATRIDLYQSQNGANNLKLHPIYEAAIAANDPRSILDLEGPGDPLTSEIQHLRSSFGAEDASEPLVDSDPYEEELMAAEVGNVIDYIRYEALLLPSSYDPATSSGSSASLFLPVLVDIGVILAFMHFLELEIYPRSNLPNDPQKAISRIDAGDVSPDASIAGEEYLYLDENPSLLEHVIDGHIGLLQTLAGSGGKHDREMLVSVLTEDTYLVGRVDASDDVYLPESVGQGLLVRVPVEDFTHEQVVGLYSDWKYLANRLRIESSLKTARTVFAASSPSEIDRTDVEDEFLTQLNAEFGSQISDLTADAILGKIGE